MELKLYSGIVRIIQAREKDVIINIGHLEDNPNSRSPDPTNESLSVDYNHPGFSAIYTLLMASATNKQPLGIEVIPFNPDAADQLQFATIIRASYASF